jgi:hypothetical protein
MRGEKIMPSTQNAVNNHEYRSVPITAIAESATNPRKRFDAKSPEERKRLTNSDQPTCSAGGVCVEVSG